MCQATLDLISPNGVPVTLHVTDADDQQTILATIDRAEKIGLYFAERGWSFTANATPNPNIPSARQGPTFAGYPCSPTVDERGFPTWIVVDGKQALRREKQGDVWYSVRVADGEYAQVLRIPKGERLPDTD